MRGKPSKPHDVEQGKQSSCQPPLLLCMPGAKHNAAMLCAQAASDTLAAREAALAAQQSSLQSDLDALLAKQEERLRAWEGGCADLEAQLEQRKAQLQADEQR